MGIYTEVHRKEDAAATTDVGKDQHVEWTSAL